MNWIKSNLKNYFETLFQAVATRKHDFVQKRLKFLLFFLGSIKDCFSFWQGNLNIHIQFETSDQISMSYPE